MPTFRTSPSSSLTAAVRRLVASGGSQLSGLQEIQADQAAADTAHKMSLVEKVRAEVQQEKAAQQERANPAMRTEFAAHSAGINLPEATQLARHIRGEVDPNPQGQEDAVGNVYGDVPVARPANLPAGGERLFRNALAAAQANLLGTGKTNAAQLTEASGNVQTQSLVQAVQDAIAKGDYQGASAMSQGAKPGTAIKLHENIGTTGATFAPASGKVAADPAADPRNVLLASNIAESKAKAEKDREAAAKDRREVAGGNLGKPPPGYRWGPVDKSSAPTLLPIAGGPAEKLGEAQIKQLLGVQNIHNAITEYRTALQKWSAVDIVNPAARARLGTVYNNMLLQAKEAYNLGVLNGPDYMILQEVITNPASIAGGVTPKGALDDQATKLDAMMGRIGVTVGASSKQRKPGGAPQSALPTVNANGWKLMKDASGNQAYVSPDGKQFEEAQ